MKLLYILNIANKVNNFCMSSLLSARELGIEYHIAGNWGYKNDTERINDEKKYSIHIHQIDFIRAPYDPRNYKAYRQLKKLAMEEGFDAIHCNTPIGGVLGRLLGKNMKINKVIYQAHGFHFYKGAPLLNRLIYYPIEKWLTRYTDALITINQEDFEFAQRKFRPKNNGSIYFLPGVGINTADYQVNNTDRSAVRKELGLSEDDVLCISMGDIIPRKNYEPAIRAIALCSNPKIHYLICGTGPEAEKLKNLANALNIDNQIHFLGFRDDIKVLLKASDIFISTSLQEGLSRSIMEAMASGLPCIASRIRGNTDLIEDGIGGYLVPASDAKAAADKIKLLAESKDERLKMSAANLERIQCFDTATVVTETTAIYKAVIGGLI